MIIFLSSNNSIRIITPEFALLFVSDLSTLEEPHAPQIKRDDDILQDVGGAYAGPFNEGEELKLLCEVHGGNNSSPANCALSHKYLGCRAAAPPGLLVC